MAKDLTTFYDIIFEIRFLQFCIRQKDYHSLSAEQKRTRFVVFDDLLQERLVAWDNVNPHSSSGQHWRLAIVERLHYLMLQSETMHFR